MNTKYILKQARFEYPAGTTVFKYHKNDYSTAYEDYLHTGIEHTSVSLNEYGGYPLFSIPTQHLQVVGE